ARPKDRCLRQCDQSVRGGAAQSPCSGRWWCAGGGVRGGVARVFRFASSSTLDLRREGAKEIEGRKRTRNNFSRPLLRACSSPFISCIFLSVRALLSLCLCVEDLDWRLSARPNSATLAPV